MSAPLRPALAALVMLFAGMLQAGEPAISFAADIVPVLRSQCATCHMTGNEPGNMRLYPSAAYDSLVGVESVSTGKLLIKPGAPDDSYMLHKIKGIHLETGGSGARMPQGQRPLDQAVIDRIVAWVEQGAENN